MISSTINVFFFFYSTSPSKRTHLKLKQRSSGEVYRNKYVYPGEKSLADRSLLGSHLVFSIQHVVVNRLELRSTYLVSYLDVRPSFCLLDKKRPMVTIPPFSRLGPPSVFSGPLFPGSGRRSLFLFGGQCLRVLKCVFTRLFYFCLK